MQQERSRHERQFRRNPSVHRPSPHRPAGDVDLDLLSEPSPHGADIDDFDASGDTHPSVLEWLAPEVELIQALIVDPDRESRFYLRAKLAMADFVRADEAATAGEALYLLKTRRYKIVILDLDLPDMDGWQLAAQVGAAPGRPALAEHIVVTRARLSWMDELRSRKTRTARYLRKPLHPIEVALLFRELASPLV